MTVIPRVVAQQREHLMYTSKKQSGKSFVRRNLPKQGIDIAYATSHQTEWRAKWAHEKTGLANNAIPRFSVFVQQ